MPARWLKVTAARSSAELDGLLGDALLSCGGSAIEERGEALVTYIALSGPGGPGDSSDGGNASDAGGGDVVAAARSRFESALREMLGADAPHLEFDEVADEDWLTLWRSGLGPRRVGEGVIVAPTWSEVAAGAADVVVRIDPQMAFGTGEHATTRGVIRLMQRVVRSGDRLVDVGAGSAILSIVAAKLGAAHVEAVESDIEAMDNAGDNVKRNDVADRVELHCAHVDDAFLEAYGGGAFDGVLANVLSSVLLPLLPAFHRALAVDGWAILSGILQEEAVAMRAAAAQAGFVVETEDAEEIWWSVLLRKQ
jgi:ribosomal protein L11 methyltransferase